MVLMLAASSVEKKLEMQASIIVGNYEFYYAAGKLASQYSIGADETTQPMELKEAVEKALEQYNPPTDDKKGTYLNKLLDRYRPSEAYDEQMRDLFIWGKTGKEP